VNTPRYITTPSGVRIGSAYQPPPARLDRDHQKVQAALLESRTAFPVHRMHRLLGAIVRWL
jgi:hypothetical protein